MDNEKIETRGRKSTLKEPLTEHMAFLITKKQRIKLNGILKENKIGLSEFIRELIFGES